MLDDPRINFAISTRSGCSQVNLLLPFVGASVVSSVEKVARTIASLKGSEALETEHVAEALNLRAPGL